MLKSISSGVDSWVFHDFHVLPSPVVRMTYSSVSSTTCVGNWSELSPHMPRNSKPK